MTTVTGNRPMVMIDLSDSPGFSMPNGSLTNTPGWLADIRRAAGERFRELDVPTARHEQWRYTNLRPLKETAFTQASLGPADVTAADLERFWLTEGVCRIVFVNGRHAADLSSVPEGLAFSVRTLDDAIAADGPLVEAALARHAGWETDAFTALNTACLEDALVVHVPEGVTVDRPVYVLHVTTCPDHAIVTHPRTLLVAGDKSRVTVIEDYVSLGDDDVHFTNAVTEAVVGVEADVRHYMIERESRAAFNISTLAARQERDSRFMSHSILFGGRLARNNVNPVLAGENAFSVLNGLYVGRDTQVLDNHMRVNHDVPNCESRQYYRGVLADRSQGVFAGRIIVARDAQKTDAVQSNANLLLSGDARASTQPQLEIYADDVKCTHGATIGELDDEALFYLRARGLSEAAARTLLVHAFAGETLERMELQDVREAVTAMMLDRLPQSELIRDAVGQG